MKIAISAESTIDMPKELLEKFDIKVVPFSILMGEDLVLDNEEVPKKIFEYVSKTKVLPKTSAVNEAQYSEHFDKLLKDYDAVVHISLSSEMSSAYSNAVNSAKTRKNVFVIDSLSLSTGIGLLALYAKKLADSGLSPEGIVEKVKTRVPNLQVSFVLNRLDYLYKGGRCSALAMFGANLLKLRPEILVKDGKMNFSKKFRGTYERVAENYVIDILETFKEPDLENVFLTYTTAPQALIEAIKNILHNRGFKNIYVTTAGGTITSHCGEECLGILYINDNID